MNPGQDRPQKRKRDENEDRGQKWRRLDWDRRLIRVPRLDADDQQQGHVVVVDYRNAYGFVDTLTFYDEPMRAARTHRGSPYLAGPPVPRVHVVFDCVAAIWFDLNVPNDLNVAWDTVAVNDQSFRAEIDIDLPLYQHLNQRLHPVTTLPMPAIEEGTWWMMRFPVNPNFVNGIPAAVTLPESNNPVSTILSSPSRLLMLDDLLVPRNLSKLQRFSHGWAIFQPPELPPYPGR